MGLGGLMVAAGGALGAAGRYGISLLPWRGELPLLTLCTNFLGALAIGFVVGLAGQRRLSPGRAVQCAYFSTAGPDIPDIPDKACFPCPGGGRAQKEIRAPYTCKCLK